MDTQTLPIIVIGAGPIGLTAAAHLVARGQTPVVLEAGASIGAAVQKWAHVRVFSPWTYNIDPVAASLLAPSGWIAPDPDHLPTGAELLRDYMLPLAALPQIAPHIRLNSRVVSVTRLGYDRAKTAGREDAPFLVRVQTKEGTETQILGRAVIDASGTYAQPNPLGASGIPAMGEAAAARHILSGIPDVLGTDRARYAGKRALVVGSGHSAFNALLLLSSLAETEPGTHIIWAVRRSLTPTLYGGEQNDALPARGSLGERLRELVDAGRIALVPNFRVMRLIQTPLGISVEGETQTLHPVDEIVAATGYRPDVAILRELRLGLDPILESPVALADLIDPNVHSCGTVPAHGAAELRHPEHDVYIVGMKSYGRAPTFLLRTGYEQVRSVVSALVGDTEGAARVELELPETGVCCSTADSTATSVAAAPVALLGKRLLTLASPSSSCCN